ncbi:tubulin epsilon and delta complex protein 2 isoform X1 [Carassius auratus]|uniref:Tubulin epsilon and delta complex protein 2-like isoform X1 n=1 Tax=Carassius auratus TaxID=7957 RepID=A0A6P6MHU8_CARAU|nr:tubulin epsilon and delta complex protein 2-like isoform X1 [Carassius auratus]XP_026095973.1 tubulin epsilon and delta complex protein 2-like isoform X1 [Carassius auratus]
MSLLQAVDEAVKMCKAEESRITENIRQCKEILRSMRTCVTETAAAVGTKDADIQPEEKQEIELLEQVLKKALKIRSTSEVHKERQPNERKNKALVNHTGKEEDKRKLVKSVPLSETSKKAIERRRVGGNVTHGVPWTRPVLVRKGPTAHPVVNGRPSVSKSASARISSNRPQQKMCVKATDAEEPSEDNSPSVSSQEVPASGEEVTAGSVRSEEQWIQSPLLPAWRAQRTKQKRLWRKVLTQQSKPVPERTKFTERLRDTFPSELPSVCPADITRELDVLTQRCLDLTHCFNAELQAQKDSDSGTLCEREYESFRMLEGLERMTAEVITCADQRKKDWESWDMRISGGLCPVRRRGEWGAPAGSCLPPVLSYSSEAELRELESQRLRVEQLQQAVHLQQAMTDSLAWYWSSRPGADGPSAVVLRGLYSLLAEGGLQFPSLVLDSESD